MIWGRYLIFEQLDPWGLLHLSYQFENGPAACGNRESFRVSRKGLESCGIAR